MRLLVAAHPVLDRRAQRRELHPLGDGVRWKQVHRLQQGGPAAVELTQRSKRRGQVLPHRHLALGVCAGKKAYGRAEPARRRAGGAGRRRLSGLEQQPDGLFVPLPRRLLDVVGPFGRISAPGGQRLGRTGMAGKTPATAHRFVNRAPHEGMTEDESPRHLGRPDKVAVEQIVEGGQRLGLAQLPYRGRQVQLEGLPGHGRGVQQRAGGTERDSSSPAMAPATAAGTPASSVSGSSGPRAPRPCRCGRAARGRTDRRPRGGRSRPRTWPPSRRAAGSLRLPSAVRARAGAPAGRPAPPPGAGRPVRGESRERAVPARWARDGSAAISSIEAPSLHCRSSSTRTSGCSPASRHRRRLTARWAR